MNDEINILILSCGTRNKIVQYFKKELADKGYVIATDCSDLAPAFYDADKYFVVPRIEDDNYIETIISICKKHNIKAVFSLIDPEIHILAKYKKDFLEIGTLPIIPNLSIVDMCFDKYKMYQFLIKNNIKTIRSYIDKGKFYRDVDLGLINYPVFIKPIKGSSSNNINKVVSKDEVELLFNRFDNLMIQEYLVGVEYGIDVYIDIFSNEPVAIFAKEKIKMRAGETDKAISVKDSELFELIKKFVKIVGFKGVIDIDLFKVNDEFYISEVNPRFGGGYPHAYECGVNIPNMIINNLKGNTNVDMIGKYDENIYMMKYNEIKILKNSNMTVI